MKRLKHLLMSGIAVFGAALVLAGPVPVGAVNAVEEGCAANPSSTICKNSGDDVSDIITTVVNILLFVVGTISVLMIIVGGIMYAVSAGEQSRITQAKNTIFYAVIGLVVSFLAFAIVNWVIRQFI